MLQGVVICDIQVEKGENVVMQLEKEFGKARAIFLKTDTSKEDEIEGFLQHIFCKLL